MILGIFEKVEALIWFLAGIGIGLILFILVFGMAVLFASKKKKVIKSKENVSYEEDVIPLKENAIKEYKTEIEKIGELAKIFDISYDLANNIAKLFFPKSNTPILELSIDEVIDLAISVSNAFDDAIASDKLLNKVYSFDMTIGFLVSLKDQKIEIKSDLKEAKENIFSRLKNSIQNKFNDMKNKAIFKYLEWNHIIDRVSMLFINVTAAETYKAFDLKIYNKKSDIDVSIKDDIEIEEKELA